MVPYIHIFYTAHPKTIWLFFFGGGNIYTFWDCFFLEGEGGGKIVPYIHIFSFGGGQNDAIYTLLEFNFFRKTEEKKIQYLVSVRFSCYLLQVAAVRFFKKMDN